LILTSWDILVVDSKALFTFKFIWEGSNKEVYMLSGKKKNKKLPWKWEMQPLKKKVGSDDN